MTTAACSASSNTLSPAVILIDFPFTLNHVDSGELPPANTDCALMLVT
jgi:hypothetical protein